MLGLISVCSSVPFQALSFEKPVLISRCVDYRYGCGGGWGQGPWRTRRLDHRLWSQLGMALEGRPSVVFCCFSGSEDVRKCCIYLHWSRVTPLTQLSSRAQDWRDHFALSGNTGCLKLLGLFPLRGVLICYSASHPDWIFALSSGLLAGLNLPVQVRAVFHFSPGSFASADP